MTSSSLLCLLTLSAMVSRTVADYTFLGIGDWGGAYLSKYNEPNEAYYKQNVDDVAAQMDIFAQRLNPQFVINTGDNFYWCGIQNTSDVQIYYDFEQPYNYSSLTGIKWYSALGVSLYPHLFYY